MSVTVNLKIPEADWIALRRLAEARRGELHGRTSVGRVAARLVQEGLQRAQAQEADRGNVTSNAGAR